MLVRFEKTLVDSNTCRLPRQVWVPTFAVGHRRAARRRVADPPHPGPCHGRHRPTPLIATVARMAGMSVRNLARVFVQEAGMTPHEFVARARENGWRGTARP